MPHPELIIIFFVIAILYSSVGFGGGSSYLAILTLFSVEQISLRAIALICNIVVVTGGTFLFYKNGYLKIKRVTPLVLLSVPAAYFGGKIQLSPRIFFITLGFTLVLAALLMFGQSYFKTKEEDTISAISNPLLNSTLGGGIGFLSGLVGIGGGIFLAPLLHLLNWGKAKTIAATASFFIMVNSISGLIGQSTNPDFIINWKFVSTLAIAVFLGGQIGSRLGAKRIKPNTVRLLTALLVLYVGCQILWKNV